MAFCGTPGLVEPLRRPYPSGRGSLLALYAASTNHARRPVPQRRTFCLARQIGQRVLRGLFRRRPRPGSYTWPHLYAHEAGSLALAGTQPDAGRWQHTRDNRLSATSFGRDGVSAQICGASLPHTKKPPHWREVAVNLQASGCFPATVHYNKKHKFQKLLKLKTIISSISSAAPLSTHPSSMLQGHG